MVPVPPAPWARGSGPRYWWDGFLACRRGCRELNMGAGGLMPVLLCRDSLSTKQLSWLQSPLGIGKAGRASRLLTKTFTKPFAIAVSQQCPKPSFLSCSLEQCFFRLHTKFSFFSSPWLFCLPFTEAVIKQKGWSLLHFLRVFAFGWGWERAFGGKRCCSATWLCKAVTLPFTTCHEE